MKLVYFCADRVGAEMAGPGIRAVELSRRLSPRHDVVLVAPGAESLADEPFARVEASPGILAPLLRSADAFLTQGFGFPLSALRGFSGRLILDLYDPVQLEQLAQFGPHPTPAQRISLGYVRARLLLVLRRADHILCASPAQRALWLGWLGAAGRLGPELLEGDPEARRFLAVVPFGLPEAPPVAAGHPLRQAVGVDPGVPLALWSGGLWDWMDPELAVRALSVLAARGHRAHLAFLAGARPGGDPMRAAADAARAATAALGLADRVHFVERWIPYAERGAWLLDADVAVTAHKPTLEAELAFRTRLLDCLWTRLPAACTAGDVLASDSEREGWGALAPTGDAEGLAAALERLLDPAENARAREAAGRAGEKRRWSVAAGTLLALLDGPPPLRPAFLRPGEMGQESALGMAGAIASKLWKRVRG
ncbi:MAG TPA: hypothetical protein VFE30_03500 [Anaeromyxobacteraceae bacterium]|nr:hypothetical protein [Anaeromyxobacteraceae bacterium]